MTAPNGPRGECRVAENEDVEIGGLSKETRRVGGCDLVRLLGKIGSRFGDVNRGKGKTEGDDQ
jgi:hypothetical protein